MTTFIKYLISFRPKYSFAILLVLAASIIIEAFGLLSVMPLLLLFSASEEPSNSDPLQIGGITEQIQAILPSSTWGLIVLLVALILLRVSLGTSYSIMHNRLKHDFLEKHRLKIFTDVAKASRSYHLSESTAGFIHVSTQVVEGLSEGLSSLYRFVAALLNALIGISISFLISPTLTSMLLILAGLFSIPLLRFDRKALSLSQKNLNLMADIYAQLESYFGGLKTIKTLGSQGPVNRHYAAAARKHAQVTEAFIRNGIIANSVTRLIAALSFLSILFAAIVLEIGFLQPVAIVIVFSRVFPNLQAVHNSARQLLSSLPDFQEFQRVSKKATAAAEGNSNDEIVLRENFELALHNVTFGYSDKPADILLSEVNVTIKASDLVAIIGPNGAGKTTFVDIVSGLLAPKSGQVAIDGTEISLNNAVSWRENIAYVTQEEYLFTGTIRENFCLVREDLSDEEIFDYLQLATAKEFVLSLKDTLDTEVGERGVRLSRGQRQKICLARSLATSASIVILDEATSAMTPMDESEIMHNLKSFVPKKTVLTIGHRFASLRYMERYLVVENGEIQTFESASDLKTSTSGYVQDLLAAS